MEQITFEDLQTMNMDEIYDFFCNMYMSVHNYHPWHIKSHEMDKMMEFLEFELRPDTVELRGQEQRKYQEEILPVEVHFAKQCDNNQEELFDELIIEDVSAMPIGEIYGLFCKMYKSVHNYHPWHIKNHEIEKMMEFIEFELRPDTLELRQRQYQLELY